MGKRSNKFQIQLNFIMTDFFAGKLGLSWDISFYHNNYPYSKFCTQTCCCRAEVVWKTQYPYSILAGCSAFRVTLSTFFSFVTPVVFVFHCFPPCLHGFVVTDMSWAHTLGGEHVPLCSWARQHRNRTQLTATPLLWGGNLWLLVNLKHPVLHLFHVTKQIKMVTGFPRLFRVKSGDLPLTTAENLFLKILWAQSLVK